ncbi:hypothetical protein BB558_007433 [Smittium angustum]|uniref:Man1/Src1-like C-terminal domain-containing protein n=1 Tax=Smittium angustum TaxID=133377 RepID=A0A2U1IV23_SMIAN|nr:hypothetical protein BB558_007433 [Smittium angustum]
MIDTNNNLKNRDTTIKVESSRLIRKRKAEDSDSDRNSSDTPKDSKYNGKETNISISQDSRIKHDQTSANNIQAIKGDTNENEKTIKKQSFFSEDNPFQSGPDSVKKPIKKKKKKSKSSTKNIPSQQPSLKNSPEMKDISNIQRFEKIQIKPEKVPSNILSETKSPDKSKNSKDRITPHEHEPHIKTKQITDNQQLHSFHKSIRKEDIPDPKALLDNTNPFDSKDLSKDLKLKRKLEETSEIPKKNRRLDKIKQQSSTTQNSDTQTHQDLPSPSVSKRKASSLEKRHSLNVFETAFKTPPKHRKSTIIPNYSQSFLNSQMRIDRLYNSPTVSELIEYYETTGNTEALKRLYEQRDIINRRKAAASARIQSRFITHPTTEKKSSSARRNTTFDHLEFIDDAVENQEFQNNDTIDGYDSKTDLNDNNQYKLDLSKNRDLNYSNGFNDKKYPSKTRSDMIDNEIEGMLSNGTDRKSLLLQNKYENHNPENMERNTSKIEKRLFRKTKGRQNTFETKQNDYSTGKQDKSKFKGNQFGSDGSRIKETDNISDSVYTKAYKETEKIQKYLENIFVSKKSSIYKILFLLFGIYLVFLVMCQQLRFKNGFVQTRHGKSIQATSFSQLPEVSDDFTEKVKKYLNFSFEKLVSEPKGLLCPKHATCNMYMPVPYKCFLGNSNLSNKQKVCISPEKYSLFGNWRNKENNLNHKESGNYGYTYDETYNFQKQSDGDVVMECDSGYIIANNRFSTRLYPLQPTCVADLDMIIKVHKIVNQATKVLQVHRGNVECSESIFTQVKRVLDEKQSKKTEKQKSNRQEKSTDRNLEKFDDKTNRKILVSMNDIDFELNSQIAAKIKKFGLSNDKLKKLVFKNLKMHESEFDRLFDLAIYKIAEEYYNDVSISRLEYVDVTKKGSVQTKLDDDGSSHTFDEPENEHKSYASYEVDTNPGTLWLVSKNPVYPLGCRIKLFIIVLIREYLRLLLIMFFVFVGFHTIRMYIKRHFEEKVLANKLVNITLEKLEFAAYQVKISGTESSELAQIPSTQLRDLLLFSEEFNFDEKSEQEKKEISNKKSLDSTKDIVENGENLGNFVGENQGGFSWRSVIRIILSVVSFIGSVWKMILRIFGGSKKNYYDIKTRQRIWQKVVVIVEKNTNIRSKTTIVRGQPMRTWEWVGPLINHQSYSQNIDLLLSPSQKSQYQQYTNSPFNLYSPRKQQNNIENDEPEIINQQNDDETGGFDMETNLNRDGIEEPEQTVGDDNDE